MTIEIPWQLQRLDFRLIKIAMDGPAARKRPLETDWQNTNNYNPSHYAIREWIARGNNYGVCCGYGNLAVIDADEEAINEIIDFRNMPKTFTVRTGSGGTHFYYFIPDLEKKIILIDKKEVHYGEIQWKGQQVVGPGSIHPSGNKYLVLRDVPIATISNNHIQEYFSEFIKKETPTTTGYYTGGKPTTHVDMTKIVNLDNYRFKGGEYVGSHPVHGSTTGGNFSINVQEELWHCFRCGTGGGPVTLIAMLEGLIKCSDCRPGIIDNATYQKVVRIAKEKYGVEINE